MERIRDILRPMVAEGLCIAFSGGVDSSLLLQLACENRGKQGIYAVTFGTKLHPRTDLAVAQRVARETGATHVVMELNEFDCPAILQNPVDRCYQCKKYLFQNLIAFAQEHGLPHIIDGTNWDDTGVYRPGIRALKELGIRSPLAELGVTKAEVREMAEALGISVSNRPSAPCLATRIPYDTPIDLELLQRIDRGEGYLSGLGFAINRIRVHGDIARIEILPQQFPTFMGHQREIIKNLKELGFLYLTLDLEGFRSGSMDIHVRGE